MIKAILFLAMGMFLALSFNAAYSDLSRQYERESLSAYSTQQDSVTLYDVVVCSLMPFMSISAVLLAAAFLQNRFRNKKHMLMGMFAQFPIIFWALFIHWNYTYSYLPQTISLMLLVFVIAAIIKCEPVSIIKTIVFYLMILFSIFSVLLFRNLDRLSAESMFGLLFLGNMAYLFMMIYDMNNAEVD